MNPLLTLLAAHAHRDDLYRETRRRRALEARVRQQLTRNSPHPVRRRTRLIPSTGH